MRKWRLSFAGLLQEEDDSTKIKRTVYVKFSFTWTASSFIFDLKSDIPSTIMAKFLSTQTWRAYSPNVEKYLDQLNSYLQAGSLTGTIQFEGGEEEIKHFFGARKRIYETSSNMRFSQVEYYSYMQEGEMVYFANFKPTREPSSPLQFGCIVMANSMGGSMENIKLSTTEDNQTTIDFSRDIFKWTASFKKADMQMTVKDFVRTQVLHFCPVTFGEQTGRGIIVSSASTGSNPIQSLLTRSIYLPILDNFSASEQPLVVSLKNRFCRHPEVSGGKGSSLADLHLLCQLDKSFSVPNGVAVTTKAYELFIQRCNFAGPLERLQIVAGKLQPEDFKRECEKVSAELGNHELPTEIKDVLRKELAAALGQNFEHIPVAVRSSASGEDSEEMSAAGQMKTFLGVEGSQQIYDAVVKCWASQFNFIACQYKRQNGQLLNSLMSVVVQEMVDAQVAGVMFTCDPVTGNPQSITITANYGIGESVVSATAEPDTINVKKSTNGEVKVESVSVGKKSLKTVLKDGGVCDEDVSTEASSECSLPDEFAEKLAKIGITVEKAYGCLVDIEWAVKDGRIYLLQARPVTTFDRETNFEIMHETDGFYRCEKESFSVANVGEVLPGATSNIGLSTLNKFAFQLLMLRLWGKRDPDFIPFCAYLDRGFGVYANHSTFNVLDSLLRFYFGEMNLMTSCQFINMLGRMIDDEELLKRAAYRNQFFQMKFSLYQLTYLLRDLWTAGSNLQRYTEELHALQVDVSHKTSVEDMFLELFEQWFRHEKPFGCHYQCSFFSSLGNMALFSILVSANNGEWSQEVYNDVAYILSSCYNVESVQVPIDIECLARAATKDYGPGFENLEPREALMWLERTDLPSGLQFREFLSKHGHRCVKEFDIYVRPWGSDPVPLIQIVQDMVGKLDKNSAKKVQISTEETVKNLKTALGWKNRFLMKKIIPLCRKAVGYREGSKSLMIGLMNKMRGAYRQLAERMVLEGYLPNPDLFYFLQHYEVLQLIKTRSPKLVQKVVRRKNLFPEMEKMVLPEMMEGFAVPINFEVKEEVREGSLCIKGVPVSQGVATGKARVATSLKEAAEIKPGEILIAYSTDIGWSPYFPMLSGVATELGGLISHGAVVAREYGLPCVVAAQGATRSFKTGDLIQIDGNKGTITRIE